METPKADQSHNNFTLIYNMEKWFLAEAQVQEFKVSSCTAHTHTHYSLYISLSLSLSLSPSLSLSLSLSLPPSLSLSVSPLWNILAGEKKTKLSIGDKQT